MVGTDEADTVLPAVEYICPAVPVKEKGRVPDKAVVIMGGENRFTSIEHFEMDAILAVGNGIIHMLLVISCHEGRKIGRESVLPGAGLPGIIA